MLAAEVALAEAAVTDDTLGSVLAVLGVAAHLLGCTATDGQSDVQCAFSGDVVG